MCHVSSIRLTGGQHAHASHLPCLGLLFMDPSRRLTQKTPMCLMVNKFYIEYLDVANASCIQTNPLLACGQLWHTCSHASPVLTDDTLGFGVWLSFLHPPLLMFYSAKLVSFVYQTLQAQQSRSAVSSIFQQWFVSCHILTAWTMLCQGTCYRSLKRPNKPETPRLFHEASILVLINVQ